MDFIHIGNMILAKDIIQSITITTRLNSKGSTEYRITVKTPDVTYYPLYFDSEYDAGNKIASIYKELVSKPTDKITKED